MNPLELRKKTDEALKVAGIRDYELVLIHDSLDVICKPEDTERVQEITRQLNMEWLKESAARLTSPT